MPLNSILRATRPKQWVKNLLVLAAPVAAGTVFEPHVLIRSLIALVAFILVSAGIYLTNDIFDLESDRLHPVKSKRPIASGELSAKAAGIAAALLLAAGIGVSAAADRPLVAVVGTYTVLMLAYSGRLKHEPVLDIAIVAIGFVLRSVAGGVASHLFISHYFLLVSGFGSLFVVAGKRYSELKRHAGEEVPTRRALASYSTGFLNFVRSVAGGVTIITYCLWAFERAATAGDGGLFIELSIVPFVIAILRYGLLIENELAEAPEDLIFQDNPLIALGVLWSVSLAIAIFAI